MGFKTNFFWYVLKKKIKKIGSGQEWKMSFKDLFIMKWPHEGIGMWWNVWSEKWQIFGSVCLGCWSKWLDGTNDGRFYTLHKINYVLWSLIYLTSKCTFRLYILLLQRQQQQLKINILIVKSEVYFFEKAHKSLIVRFHSFNSWY